MENLNLHVDVMSEVYNYQLNELLEKCKNGTEVNFEDYIEFTTVGTELYYKRYMEMFEICNDYSGRIIRMANKIKREKRILELFLTNHKLLHEFEGFESRILERIIIK